MEPAEFLRVHRVRVPNIMWFLGAGASASSGVPTAGQMVWEFRRELFCAEQGVPLAMLSDLNDPVVRARLTGYFTDDPRFRSLPPEEEYAAYFETTFPDESDRQRYIDGLMADRTPSYGYRALAVLLVLGRVRVVWTTNFDPLLEDGVGSVPEARGRLTVATLEGPDIALQALNDGRWPLLVKLHGDYRSRRLKNTTAETQAQDARFREALTEGCRRFGLAVIGYSGRDCSVIEALDAALDAPAPFPNGLFWFHRSSEALFPNVVNLLEKAVAAAADAHLVEVETFDEVMADLLLLENVPDDLQRYVDRARPPEQMSLLHLPARGGSWPVLRLNAIRVDEYPSTSRLVRCRIGPTAEVRQAIADSQADIIAVRRQDGVVGFGSDSEMRKAFGRYGIEALDLAAIEPRRLRRENSADLLLLYDGLARAVTRERPLTWRSAKSGHLLIVDTDRANDEALVPLRELLPEGLTGAVPGTALRWAEAVRIRLEYRFDSLWLTMRPTVWVEHGEDSEAVDAADEFARERMAGRYNRRWTELLVAWGRVVRGGAQPAELRAFGIGDGVDAVFRLGRSPAYSFTEGP